MNFAFHTTGRIFLLGLWLLATCQCTQKPSSPVGIDFFQRKNEGLIDRTVFLASASDTSFHVPVSCGSGSRLYAGRVPQIECTALILFDSLPDSGTVDSCGFRFSLQVPAATWNTEPLTLDIHLMQISWTESDALSDTWNEGMIGEKTAEITANPGDSSRVEAAVDPTIVNKWIDGEDGIDNLGICLKTSSGTGMVSFYSSEYAVDTLQPSLFYTVSGDTSRAVKVARASRDAFVTRTDQPVSPGMLLVANGYAMRSYLRFGGLSELDSTATINRARLTLHPDSSAGFRDGGSFNLYAYPLSTPFSGSAEVVFDSTSISLGTPGEPGTEINCTALVQEWVAGLSANNGLLITGSLESIDPWLRLYHSSQADSAFRPSLEIFYSLPPKSQF